MSAKLLNLPARPPVYPTVNDLPTNANESLAVVITPPSLYIFNGTDWVVASDTTTGTTGAIYSHSATVSVTTAQLHTITSLTLPPGQYIVEATCYGETAASDQLLYDEVDFRITTVENSQPFQNPGDYGINQIATTMYKPEDLGTPYPGIVSGSISGYSFTNATEDNQVLYLTTQNSQYDYTARGILTALKIYNGDSFRGGYDASTNLFPATGGSGPEDEILSGNYWVITVAGTLGGTPVLPSDYITALINSPGQTASNWIIDSTNYSFNSDQFVVVDNEVSIKTAGITLALMDPNGTDGKLLTSAATTNPPKYRTLLGTTSQVIVTVNTSDITLSGPQNLGTGSSPTFLSTTLTNTTASRVMVTDGLKLTTTSTVTSSELLNVGGSTSNIQTQLNGKQATGNYITALTGDVTASGPGSVAATIAASVVTLAKMADLAANSIIGNNTGSSATPLALTVAQVQTMLSPSVTTDATASITLDASVNIINLTNTGARDVSIPAIVPGKIWTVKDAAFSALTGNITITPTVPILIDGQTTYVMLVNGASISIYTDGTNLFVM